MALYHIQNFVWIAEFFVRNCQCDKAAKVLSCQHRQLILNLYCRVEQTCLYFLAFPASIHALFSWLFCYRSSVWINNMLNYTCDTVLGWRNSTRCNSKQIFIYCWITLHVSGVHRSHIRSTWNCSCSLWYRSYYMGSKLLQEWPKEDDWGRMARHHPHRTHDLRSCYEDHHPSKNSVQQTIRFNSTSNAPDDGRMYPKHVELRIHQ